MYDSNKSYLKDRKTLTTYFKEYLAYNVAGLNQEKYDYLAELADTKFSYNELVLFYCITDNFWWDWARDLIRDTEIIKEIDKVTKG